MHGIGGSETEWGLTGDFSIIKKILENLEEKDGVEPFIIVTPNGRSTRDFAKGNADYVINEDGKYKTGLYVKDSIKGIGTLTYIDPNSKIYGALGHEILESNTSKMIEVKDGTIFSEQVIEIKFNADNIVSEVLINEKYSTKEAAESSYNSMIADGIYEEILLDGNVITYNATSSFEYEGKTKEEMLNIMNNFEHDGINSGYSITWK